MIALVILLALMGGLIILANPFVGLLAVIILIPQALVPAVGSMFLGAFTAVTPIKIVGGLTFVATFFHHIAKARKWDFLKEPMVVFYIWFLIYVFINGFAMPSSFTRENFTFYVSIAVLGFVILSQVQTLKRLRVIIWVFMLASFIVSLQSIINFLVTGQGISRMAGATYGPNYFAISLLPFIGISFYNVGAEKSRILKIFSLIICVTLLGALAVTQSRGGFVGLLFMLLIGLFTARKKFVGLIAVLVFSTLILTIMPEHFWKRFSETKIEAETSEEAYGTAIGSTARRWYLAKAAMEMFADHPVLGVGLGNYYWECPLYYPLVPGRAHSMYLEILAEMGTIGIFLFGGIIVAFLKCLRRLKSADPPFNVLAKGFFVGQMGFLAAAIFLHAQQDKGFWMIMFLAVAMERIWRKQRGSTKTIKSGKRQ